MKRLVSPLITLALIVAVWQAVIWLTGVRRFILPDPWSVAEALWRHRASLAEHTVTTLTEIVLGILIAVTLGMLTALLLMASKTARERGQILLVITQALPVFALAPILTLWLGYGLWSKIAMASLIIYFPVTVTFFDGLRRTDPGLLDLARVMGGTPRRILWLIRAPSALPALASGLKLAAVYAPIGAVIGEWVGASHGLGYLMLRANGEVKTDLMFACVIVLAALAVTLHALVSAFAARLAGWRPESADQPESAQSQ
ncbi:MAG: ABC transporter permease [Pseudomonadota bacterium]